MGKNFGTANTGREVLGKGGVINPKHEGPVGSGRNPVEEKLGEYSRQTGLSPNQLGEDRRRAEAAAKQAKQDELNRKDAEEEAKRKAAIEAAELRRQQRQGSGGERNG